MGFAYSESMWDEMYASVGGYENFQKSGGSIVRTDLGSAGKVTTTFYENTPAEIQAAAAQPTISMEEWNQQAAESQRQAAIIEQTLNTGPLPINPILPGVSALTPVPPQGSAGGGSGLLMLGILAAAYLCLTSKRKRRKA